MSEVSGVDERARIRVVLVEDHPMTLEGTQAALERDPGIVVVGATGEGERVLPLVAELRPDVVVLDLRLPDIEGTEVARRLRQSYPAVRVVVLTQYDEVALYYALQGVGVRGYLPKTASGDEIARAVRRVASGHAVWVQEGGSTPLGDVPQLTTREHEVLRILAEGLRNGQIAGRLSISERTAEAHVRNVLGKIRAPSRAAAILKAQQLGLVKSQAVP